MVFFQWSYRISWIFRVGLIFAECAISLKSPKIDTAKNKPYFMSSLRVLEIAKIGLSENLTHLTSVIFAKISRREKFPIYGNSGYAVLLPVHYLVKSQDICWHAPGLPYFPSGDIHVNSIFIPKKCTRFSTTANLESRKEPRRQNTVSHN